jgi:hypothetical protein
MNYKKKFATTNFIFILKKIQTLVDIYIKKYKYGGRAGRVAQVVE